MHPYWPGVLTTDRRFPDLIARVAAQPVDRWTLDGDTFVLSLRSGTLRAERPFPDSTLVCLRITQAGCRDPWAVLYSNHYPAVDHLFAALMASHRELKRRRNETIAALMAELDALDAAAVDKK